jgi:hypothetical protein
MTMHKFDGQIQKTTSGIKCELNMGKVKVIKTFYNKELEDNPWLIGSFAATYGYDHQDLVRDKNNLIRGLKSGSTEKESIFRAILYDIQLCLEQLINYFGDSEDDLDDITTYARYFRVFYENNRGDLIKLGLSPYESRIMWESCNTILHSDFGELDINPDTIIVFQPDRRMWKKLEKSSSLRRAQTS